MIIDAHTHTYPETIAKRAIEKLEKNSGTKAHTNGVQESKFIRIIRGPFLMIYGTSGL